MGFLRSAGRGVAAAVEVLGRTLDAVFGVGVRSRGVAAREQRRREDELERLTRRHAEGQLSDREFARRRRRL